MKVGATRKEPASRGKSSFVSSASSSSTSRVATSKLPLNGDHSGNLATSNSPLNSQSRSLSNTVKNLKYNRVSSNDRRKLDGLSSSQLDLADEEAELIDDHAVIEHDKERANRRVVNSPSIWKHSVTLSVNKGGYYRRFVFVINNWTNEHFNSIKIACKSIQPPITALLMGKENAPTTGTPHLQGYCILGSNRQWKTARIQKEFCKGYKGMYISYMDGLEINNIKYCTKQDDSHYYVFPEREEFEDSEIARNPMERVVQKLKRGTDVGELLRTAPLAEQVATVRQYKNLLFFREEQVQYRERGRLPLVVWLYGDTGLGKTWICEDFGYEKTDQKFWKSEKLDLHFFNFYDGHKCAIFDDFRSEGVPLSVFLKLLDRYNVSVEIKGSDKKWIPEYIFITSPEHPEEYFKKHHNPKWTRENPMQLLRRIDGGIWNFNDPDEMESCAYRLAMISGTDKNGKFKPEYLPGEEISFRTGRNRIKFKCFDDWVKHYWCMEKYFDSWDLDCGEDFHYNTVTRSDGSTKKIWLDLPPMCIHDYDLCTYGFDVSKVQNHIDAGLDLEELDLEGLDSYSESEDEEISIADGEITTLHLDAQKDIRLPKAYLEDVRTTLYGENKPSSSKDDISPKNIRSAKTPRALRKRTQTGKAVTEAMNLGDHSGLLPPPRAEIVIVDEPSSSSQDNSFSQQQVPKLPISLDKTQSRPRQRMSSSSSDEERQASDTLDRMLLSLSSSNNKRPRVQDDDASLLTEIRAKRSKRDYFDSPDYITDSQERAFTEKDLEFLDV